MRRAVLVGLADFTVAVLPPFLVGALATQIRDDLHLGETGIGAVIGGFWIVAALTSTWLGGVSEHLGASLSLRIGASGCAATLLVVAVGGSSWAALALGLLAAGAANALMQPAASAFLARTVPIARRGRAFGIMLTAIPLANVLGGLAVPALALTVGWRWAFVAGAVFAAASAWSTPNVPSAPALRGDQPRDHDREQLRMWRSDAPVALLILLAVAAGLAAAATSSLGAFLVQGAGEIGIEPGAAGWLFAGGSMAALVTRLLLGEVADHHRSALLRMASLMLVVSTIPVLGLAAGNELGYVLSTFFAFSLAWGWPGMFNLAIVELAPAAPAFATGIAMTGVFLGCAIGPLLFGVVAESTSYRWAWCVVAVLALLGGAVMALGQMFAERRTAVTP